MQALKSWKQVFWGPIVVKIFWDPAPNKKATFQNEILEFGSHSIKIWRNMTYPCIKLKNNTKKVRFWSFGAKICWNTLTCALFLQNQPILEHYCRVEWFLKKTKWPHVIIGQIEDSNSKISLWIGTFYLGAEPQKVFTVTLKWA